MNWSQHLILVPVLLPMLCGALLILINEKRHGLKFSINMVSVLVLLGNAMLLLWLTNSGYWSDSIGVYLSGNWVAPFGISLVIDRLAALMLVLTAFLSAASLLYAMQGWSRIGVHFHSMFQFLLMGINGAFLTHDLFNLFVFFEVMLAASYGLLLHGYNLNRLRAGMQFIAINLVASLFFLIGIALIYAAIGTLNMADLAARVPTAAANELLLLKIGTAIMTIAFLVKSAMWPLCFWLPTTYAAASPPVAAMLVLMTKVGVYVIVRLWLLVFGDDSVVSGFGRDALLWGGMATIGFGAAGMLASDDYRRLAGYGSIVSSGILLAVVGLGHPTMISAALFYLLGSTLAVGAFMLLIELVERSRNPVAAMLAVTIEAFEFEETPEQPVGVGIPGAMAFLGLAFLTCALVIAGLPPLPGFIAKFSLLHALLGAGDADSVIAPISIALMLLLLLSGLAATIALIRNGVRTFWGSGAVSARLQITEVVPVTLLLFACLLLTFQAGPVMRYLHLTSEDLHNPSRYIDRVLSEQALPGVIQAEGGDP